MTGNQLIVVWIGSAIAIYVWGGTLLTVIAGAFFVAVSCKILGRKRKKE